MARSRGPLFLVPICLVAVGCVQPTDPEGSTGYVLLDREARGALTLAHDGWEGAPVLPLALNVDDVEEPVTLRGADGETLLLLRGGHLAHVRGAAGEVSWLEVGSEARADRLVLHGDEAAVAELAERVSGKAALRGDGFWSLSAPELLDRTSFLNPPEGVMEVLPETRMDLGGLEDDSSSAVRSALVGSLVAATGDGASALTGAAEAELVGLYQAGTRSLLLDASGGFTLEDRCTGEAIAAGRYYAIEGRVALAASPGSAPIVMAREGDTLLHPGGAVFAPLEIEPPKEKRRGLFAEQLGDEGDRDETSEVVR